MSELSRYVVLALMSLTAGFAVYLSVDPLGYCASEKRIIPDSEFQRATFNILKMQRQLVLSVTTLGGATRHNIKPYEEKYSAWAKSFDAKNCCDVEREDGFFRRATGLQEIVVRVNPQAPKWHDDWLTFRYDVCGNLKSSDAGVPSSELHNLTTTNKDLQDDGDYF